MYELGGNAFDGGVRLRPREQEIAPRGHVVGLQVDGVDQFGDGEGGGVGAFGRGEDGDAARQQSRQRARESRDGHHGEERTEEGKIEDEEVPLRSPLLRRTPTPKPVDPADHQSAE